MSDIRSAGLRGGKLTAALLVVVPAATALAAPLAQGTPRSAVGDVACACPVAAVPTGTPAPGAPAAATQAIVNRICGEVARLQQEASTNDLEAAIVFAVSQSDARPAVVAAALTEVGGCDYGRRHFAAALQRVRSAMLRRKLGRGTAAIAGGNVMAQSSFSAPLVNVGGGSSNYTR